MGRVSNLRLLGPLYTPAARLPAFATPAARPLLPSLSLPSFPSFSLRAFSSILRWDGGGATTTLRWSPHPRRSKLSLLDFIVVIDIMWRRRRRRRRGRSKGQQRERPSAPAGRATAQRRSRKRNKTRDEFQSCRFWGREESEEHRPSLKRAEASIDKGELLTLINATGKCPKIILKNSSIGTTTYRKALFSSQILKLVPGFLAEASSYFLQHHHLTPYQQHSQNCFVDNRGGGGLALFPGDDIDCWSSYDVENRPATDAGGEAESLLHDQDFLQLQRNHAAAVESSVVAGPNDAGQPPPPPPLGVSARKGNKSKRGASSSASSSSSKAVASSSSDHSSHPHHQQYPLKPLSREEKRRRRRASLKYRMAHATRERLRVEAFNSAFFTLRQLLPTLPPDKKLSKIEILKLSICYITYLNNVLAPHQNDGDQAEEEDKT